MRSVGPKHIETCCKWWAAKLRATDTASVLFGLHDTIVCLPRVHVLVGYRLHHRILDIALQQQTRC